jgi:hypothetical protein
MVSCWDFCTGGLGLNGTFMRGAVSVAGDEVVPGGEERGMVTVVEDAA